MWFLIVSIFVFNAIASIIPKRLTRAEIYATTLFALVFVLVVDLYLDVKYDFYGYFNPGVDWAFLIPLFGLYPAVSLIFLNYYPYQKPRSALIYIIGWTVFIVLFELASVYSGYFYYNRWNAWYSLLVYPAVFYILAQNLRLFRKIKVKD